LQSSTGRFIPPPASSSGRAREGDFFHLSSFIAHRSSFIAHRSYFIAIPSTA
jgi:hypothetical protein